MSCVEKTPKTNLEIRLWVRNKLNTVVKNKAISKKIEVGIYNFTINQSDKYGIAKLWSNILKTIDCYSDLKKKNLNQKTWLLWTLKQHFQKIGKH